MNKIDLGSYQYEGIGIVVDKYYKEVLKIEDFKEVKKYLKTNLNLGDFEIKIKSSELAWGKIVKAFQLLLLEENEIDYSAKTLINKYNAGKLIAEKLGLNCDLDKFIDSLQPKEFTEITAWFKDEGWDLWGFLDGFLAEVFGIEVEVNELSEEELLKFEDDEEWDEIADEETIQYATILLYTIWLFKIGNPVEVFGEFST